LKVNLNHDATILCSTGRLFLVHEESILNTATCLKVMLKFFGEFVELLVCLTAAYRLSGGKFGKGSCDLLKAVLEAPCYGD